MLAIYEAFAQVQSTKSDNPSVLEITVVASVFTLLGVILAASTSLLAEILRGRRERRLRLENEAHVAAVAFFSRLNVYIYEQRRANRAREPKPSSQDLEGALAALQLAVPTETAELADKVVDWGTTLYERMRHPAMMEAPEFIEEEFTRLHWQLLADVKDYLRTA